jgi:EmrB/QacA subfamily drug resistance transporter
VRALRGGYGRRGDAALALAVAGTPPGQAGAWNASLRTSPFAGRDGGKRPAVTHQENPGNRSWLILAVVLIGSFMAVLDTTIVNVALPSIGRGAHATADALEWVVSGYALTFGLALVPAGRIGDRFGYKRLFLAGLSLFVVASVACGVSGNSAQLVAARLVQGLGAGIYYPAISAIIQRLFTGRDRSRAFGYLGGVVGISTAVGPLLGGLLIMLAGPTGGWRWVFLVNVIIGAVELPVAWRVIPRRHQAEEHRLDLAGNGLLALTLLLILVPLVEGRVSGWPAWSWLLLALAGPAGLALTWWEVRLDRRGGEPVVQVGLLRAHRSFGIGQLLALVYFAGFTSLFFTLSIMWQEGLGRSALSAGLLVLPFAVGALVTAANSFRFSRRFGRVTVQAGIGAMLSGQALVALVLFQSSSHPGYWALAGPLLLAGLGNGLVIAPNQDFVLADVPRSQAGTAGGALITAQRLGAAIGIAVIGTALFGGGSGAGGPGSGGGGSAAGGHGGGPVVMPSLVHHAGIATLVNLCFIVAALACAFGLPRRLAGDDGDEPVGRAGGRTGGEARRPRETPRGRPGAAGITRPRSG